MFARQQSLEQQLENGDLGAYERRRLTTVLARLDDALNPRSKEDDGATGDPLIDRWEKEWAAGKMPNLDEK